MTGRRTRLETYRDVLLAVGYSSGYITRVMGWTGLSYISLKKTLEQLVARNLIELVPVSGSGRSRFKLEVTDKGAIVTKLLVELMRYVDDPKAPGDPKSEPPVWMMRRAMFAQGLDLEPPTIVEALPDFSHDVPIHSVDTWKGHLFAEPMSSERKMNLPAGFYVQTTLEASMDLAAGVNLPGDGAQAVRAGFRTRRPGEYEAAAQIEKFDMLMLVGDPDAPKVTPVPEEWSRSPVPKIPKPKIPARNNPVSEVMEIEHTDDWTKCSECGRTAPHSKALKIHLKKKHGIKAKIVRPDT